MYIYIYIYIHIYTHTHTILSESFDGAVYGRKDVGPGAAEFLFLRKMDAVEKERAAIAAPEAAAPTCDLVSLANFVRQQVRRVRMPQTPPMMMFIYIYMYIYIYIYICIVDDPKADRKLKQTC